MFAFLFPNYSSSANLKTDCKNLFLNFILTRYIEKSVCSSCLFENQLIRMMLCSRRVSACFAPASCSYGSSGFFCSAFATRKSRNWILSSASKWHSSHSTLCGQPMFVLVLWCRYNPSKTLCLGNGSTKKEKSVVRPGRSDPMRARQPANSSPSNRRNGDNDVPQEGNIWDSNAENVWRCRTYSKDFSPQSDKSSKIPPGWTQSRKQWDYDSGDKTSDSRWQWWQFTKDADEYDYESEDEQEEEDSAFDFDIKSILQEQGFSLLRWGSPFMLLVLPWLLGNPLVVMIGLAAIPAVQKATGPIWRSFLDFAGYPVQPKRRWKPPSNRQVNFEERGEKFAGWGPGVDDGRPGAGINGSSMTEGDIRYSEDVPYQGTDVHSDRFSQDSGAWSPAVARGGGQVSEAGRAGEMRGWDELTADRSRRPTQWAVEPIRLGRKRAKKEKPLLFRLILALFPFLQGWGGWLFVVMFLPVLDSFWAAVSVSDA